MSQLLRGLLGAVEGAGHGYFRGQQMKRDQAEEQERLRMAQERERIAQEDQDFQRQDRERQAGERLTAESNRLRTGIVGHLRSAAVSDLVRQSLLPGDEANGAIDRLAQIAPERLSGIRQIRNDRQPPATPNPPWEREGFASEADQLGYVGRRAAAGRMPRAAGGGDDETATPKPRTLNTIQDSANDYVARFATIPDPTERAKQAYQAFLVAGQRPQAGENPDQVWTAFVAASRRMAGGASGSAKDKLMQLLAPQDTTNP